MLVELTRWCATNTQPLYPIGLIFMPLGLLFSLLGFTQLCASADLNILRGKATILTTTYYVQFSKDIFQEYYTIQTSVSLRKKAIPPPTHWALPCTFLEE